MGAELGSKDDLAALAASAEIRYSASLLARRFGYSSRQFLRLFQKEHKCATARWLKELKNSNAQKAMAPGVQMKTISAKLFYKTPGSFSRAFARLNHAAPSNYQREQAAKGIIRKIGNNNSEMSENGRMSENAK